MAPAAAGAIRRVRALWGASLYRALADQAATA